MVKHQDSIISNWDILNRENRMWWTSRIRRKKIYLGPGHLYVNCHQQSKGKDVSRWWKTAWHWEDHTWMASVEDQRWLYRIPLKLWLPVQCPLDPYSAVASPWKQSPRTMWSHLAAKYVCVTASQGISVPKNATYVQSKFLQACFQMAMSQMTVGGDGPVVQWTYR